MKQERQFPAESRLASDPASGGKDPDIISIGALLATVWRRKWVVVVIMLMCLGTAFVALKKMTPKYTSTTQIMLNTRDKTVIDFQSVVSGLPADANQVEGEIAVITSNQLLERVIENLRLDLDPEYNAKLRPEPFVKAWIESSKEWVRSQLPADVQLALGLEETPEITDPEIETEQERQEVRGALAKALSVNQVGLSVVIAISVTAEDARKAALIANTVSDQYLIDQLEAKFEETRRATAWLNERVSHLRSAVELAEGTVEDYKAELTEGEGQAIEITTQQLGELNTELIAARAQRAEAAARYEQVRRRVENGGFGAAAQIVSSPLILELRQQLAEVGRRRADLSTRYGDRHPRMINIRAEIGDINGAISQEVRKIVEGLRNDLEVADAREQTLKDSLSDLEDKAATQSKGSVRLRQLEREAEASRLIYETFLTRFKETSEQESLQEADARIISKAVPARQPSEPKKGLLLGLAGAAGMAIGLGLVFVLEVLNNTFRTPAEVEDVTNTTVLASLPVLGRRRRRSHVLQHIADRPNSALAEAVRNLRTSLFLTNIDQPPQTIMATSSLPGEGKSTTCILLAYMSAQVGKTSIIVDCDIRRPTLHDTFKIADQPDIISVLDGSATLDEVIWKDPESGLSVLPAIRPAPQAADILSSKRFAWMVEELRKRYDLVLLDTPPVLLVSDAGVVGKFADTVIYMVRWDHTRRDTTLSGIKQLRDFGLRLSGTVLTQVEPNKASRYSYSGYGYGHYGTRNHYFKN